MPDVHAVITKSSNPAKKFMVVIDDGTRRKTIHFGAAGMSDYTIHKDSARKERYLNRHRKHEDWTDYWTAGFWSAHLLWGKPTLLGSAHAITKRFGIKIHME